MGIIDKLFRKPHPSESWQKTEYSNLVLDLGRHALSEVRIGDPVQWFSKLGPPEDKGALRDGCYRYPSRGIEIGADEGTVRDLIVVWSDEWTGKHFRPFAGQTVYHGRDVGLNGLTQEGSFVGLFGEPYWRDEDDSEILLFYEFAMNIEWQAEFTREGRLRCLIITSPPLMGSPEQRKAYGVTKEWPPEWV